MSIWMLYAILSTGEAGPVPVSEYVCRKLVADLAAGATIEVDRYDGTRAGIVAASCLGPTDVDPCEQEASS
jgi:hypothetical protein